MAALPGCSTWRTLSGFRRLTERERFRGSLISVAEGTFEAPDGSTFERDVVHHPGAVSVVPVLGQSGEVVMIRQYRAAVDRVLLEIPAGKRDVAGEPPEETARRELIEEIGMRAGRLERLAEFFNSPGFSDEHSFVFMALDLEACQSDLQGIEEHYMVIERVALDDVGSLITSGAIADAKTIIGLILARQALA
jgi:8-oxo-dGTP pyrophosphatase MutT (NUDIX family)